MAIYVCQKLIDVRYPLPALKFSNKFTGPSWSWAALDYSSAHIQNLLILDDYRVKPLVNILEAHMELVGSDSFGPLRGGYLRLTGRIGRIFSLANTARLGVLVRGHYSYTTEMDIEPNSNHFMHEECLYCLPVLVRKLYSEQPQGSPTMTDCLLLKQLKPGVREYMRLGRLSVSLDPHDLLPEIRWIAEYANSDIDSSDLVTITPV